MKYPTKAEVESADHEQVCRWWRFLPSPGEAFLDDPSFEEKLEEEVACMELIQQKLNAFGGFTPGISKRIGWDA